jgi:hypothetical protein
VRAVLWEIPRAPEAWLRWSYHHRNSHDNIRNAIDARGGHLPVYPLDPIDGPHIGDFLQYNGQMHSDMNAALGLQGVDLLSVDFNDEAQRTAWVLIHAREHESAELKLGI